MFEQEMADYDRRWEMDAGPFDGKYASNRWHRKQRDCWAYFTSLVTQFGTDHEKEVVRSILNRDRMIRRHRQREERLILDGEDFAHSNEPIAPPTLCPYEGILTSDPKLLEALEATDIGDLKSLRDTDPKKRKRAQRKRAQRYRAKLSEQLGSKVDRERVCRADDELKDQARTKLKLRQREFQHKTFCTWVQSWEAA